MQVDSVRPDELSDDEFLKKCQVDPLWFFKWCLKVVDKQSKRLVPFELNYEQMAVFETFKMLWEAGQPVRLIVLKARQMGISTLAEGLGYWMVSLQSQCNGLVLSHEVRSGKHIFAIAERYAVHDYRHARQLFPAVRRTNVTELVFATPNARVRYADPGLDSTLSIATADNQNAGHGWTGSFFHGSEVARWPRPELLAGVLNALTDAPRTLGILESTAHGRSGVFWETWQDAVDAKNGWLPIFLPWHRRVEYSVLMSETEKKSLVLEPEEERLIAEHGLELEQVQWRRKKIASPECKGHADRSPEEVFQEQFPLTPDEAFVSSGRQYFEPRSLSLAEANARTVEYQDGWLDVQGGWTKTRPNQVVFHERKPLDGHLSFVRAWALPEPEVDYVVGADIAGGHAEGDWSVAYVLRRDMGQVVARIRARIDPMAFAEQLLLLSWWYNEAFLSPENNSIGMIVAKHTSSRYSRHAYEVDKSRPNAPKYHLDRPGWNTHTRNRKEMFAYLRQALKDNLVVVWDQDFFDEAWDFIVPEDEAGRLKEGMPKAARHKHDDCVAALAIALQADSPDMAGMIRKPKSSGVHVVEEGRQAWRSLGPDDQLREDEMRRRDLLFADDDALGWMP